jgi:hypothetical protein
MLQNSSPSGSKIFTRPIQATEGPTSSDDLGTSLSTFFSRDSFCPTYLQVQVPLVHVLQHLHSPDRKPGPASFNRTCLPHPPAPPVKSSFPNPPQQLPRSGREHLPPRLTARNLFKTRAHFPDLKTNRSWARADNHQGSISPPLRPGPFRSPLAPFGLKHPCFWYGPPAPACCSSQDSQDVSPAGKNDHPLYMLKLIGSSGLNLKRTLVWCA